MSFNCAITPGIFTWSPMDPMFAKVKTNINGGKVFSRISISALMVDLLSNYVLHLWCISCNGFSGLLAENSGCNE